jgi:phage gp29-like protein
VTKRYRKPGGGAAQKPDSRALAAVAPSNVTTLPMRPPVGRQSPKPSIWTWVPYNSFTELSWPQIVSILKSAEQGQTEQWADLACRMRATDDHLYSVCETRVSSVAGADWKLNPGQGDEALAQRAADDCERALRGIPNLKRCFRDILDGVFVGWSVLEIIWEPRGDEWLPVELVWLHPRRFRFAEDFSLYLWDDGRAATAAAELGIDPVSYRGAAGMPLSPNKYVIHIPRVLQTYPTSSGLLNACIKPWWVKLWVTKFWLAGAEVAGNPRYIATAPQGTPADVFESLHEGLQTLAADGVGAFREGVEVTVQAPLAQGAGGVWETQFNIQNAGMSKAVLGSTLNVEIGDTGGAYSAAESQGDVTITPRILGDASAMWETIARDIFRPYLFFNRHRYGGAVPPIPRGETILFETKIEVDELLVKTGSVTKNELRQSRGLDALPPEKGGDELIPAEQPAAPAFGFSQPAAATQEAPAAHPLRATPGPAPWEAALRIATSTSSRSPTK